MIRAHRCLILMIVLALAAGVTSAQVTTGTPPFSSIGGGPDEVNLANLNVHYTFPVVHKPGRGLPFNFDLAYDTSFWEPVLVQDQYGDYYLIWAPTTATDGWSVSPMDIGSMALATPEISGIDYAFFIYYDGVGTSHVFPGYAAYNTSNHQHSILTVAASDDSGYVLNGADACGKLAPNGQCEVTFVLTSADGNNILPLNAAPLNSQVTPGSVADRNGNEITGNLNLLSNPQTDTFTDTLGVTALQIVYASLSLTQYNYTSPAGTLASVTATYKPYNLATNFGCTPVNGVGDILLNNPGPYLTDRLTLPNGTYYQFTYEPTPGYPGDVTGRLASITLPTGGTISYTYTGPNNGINCADGSAMGLIRTTPDGTWTYTRTLGSGAASTTTMTDPQGNVTVVQFQGIYETQRAVYNGSAMQANLLKTITTCYNGNTTNCPSTAITLPITQRTVFTQWANGQESKIDNFYNSYGLETQTNEYDYGSGAPGALLRQTIISYACLGGTVQSGVCLANGNGVPILTKSAQVTVEDGSGNVKAQTTYAYDQTTPTTTSAPQHLTLPSSYARGNLTTLTRTVQGSTTVSKTTTYFDTGMVQTAKDFDGNPTTYGYSATYGYAYPTTVTNALNQTTTTAYDVNTGVVTSTTDPNNQTTTFTYDNMIRPLTTNYPDGGQTAYCYTDTGGSACSQSGSPYSVVLTERINSSQNLTATAVADGLGRPKQTQLNSDPDGTDYADTTYDSLGRTATVSNPYRSTSDSTYGITTYTYDALNRVTQILDADGSKVQTSYAGNASTVTDEAGIARQSTTDGLGRLSQVIENPGGLNYTTTYTHDALDDLTQVNQGSLIPRVFGYDDLSRLTSATLPETGTTTYTYDNNGNLRTKTDARGTVTTYGYDALNRLTGKTYSDGTLAVNFYYDSAPAYWAYGEQNTTGRLVEATTNNTAMELSYDAMGRVNQQAICTPQNCGNGGYGESETYNYLGGLTQFSSYSSTLSQTFDNAGRVASLSSNFIYYPATTLATLDPLVGYHPNGAIRKVTLGNGLTETTALNNRLQPCRMNINSSGGYYTACPGGYPAGWVQDWQLNYEAGSSDNGDVAYFTGAGQQNFYREYVYDQMDRLLVMEALDSETCGELYFTYDAYGNRVGQTPISGTCPAWSQTANAKNQIVGYAYDAAGNLLNDGVHSYAYDAENRITQVDGGATASYVYDAFGKRVEKTAGGNITEYVYNADGQVAWIAVNGHFAMYYAYLNGRRLAQYNGGIYFLHGDHLGSTRLVSTMSQSFSDNMDFLPFGEQETGDTGTVYKFTGAERDAETNLDYMSARHYSSMMGRFMTPDPAGMAVADPANPQSWNMYAYVTNSPMTLTDPTGLDGEDDGGWGDGGGDDGGGGCLISCTGGLPSIGSWPSGPSLPTNGNLGGIWSEYPLPGNPNIPTLPGGGVDWARLLFGSCSHCAFSWGPFPAGDKCVDGWGRPIVCTDPMAAEDCSDPDATGNEGNSGACSLAYPPPAPSPKPSSKGEKSQPTQQQTTSYIDFLACELNEDIANVDPEPNVKQNPFWVVNAAPFIFASRGNGPATATSLVVAGIYDLGYVLKNRETCVQSVYGPGYF